VIALALALAFVAVAAQPPAVALATRHRCEPFAEVCRGSVIYTCVAGRWVRGLDCARAGRRDRVTVCEVEPGGGAVCVESGGASPFPGDRR
jgi:hypothetical protein